MSENNIRTGKVSSINYEEGTIRVVYTDKNNAVTTELPVLNFNGEYKMPQIDDMVLVTHLSNGSSLGIVCGSFWSSGNKPVETGEGLYRKELGAIPGEAYIKYDSKTKTVIIKAENIIFESASVKATEITVETLNASTINS